MKRPASLSLLPFRKAFMWLSGELDAVKTRLKRMLYILRVTFSLGSSVCLSSIKAPQLHKEMPMEPQPTLILSECCSNQMM